MSALSRIRRATGRSSPAGSREVFLRLYLLHLLGRPPKLQITCAERSDGAGAQVHTIMSAINFARAFGHTYVHTPFSNIDHGDRPMDEWVQSWEALFNLGEGEEQIAPDKQKPLNYSTFHPRLYHFVCGLLEGRKGGRRRSQARAGDPEFHFQPFFYHSDCDPESYRSVLPDFRRKYYRGTRPAQSDRLQVAVHVRRGDVSPSHPQRYSPTDTVCATLRSVTSVLDASGEEFSVAVYSQGEPSDFRAFDALGARLFLDADPIWTMRQLIAADVLVMSKSSFSYAAALISEGIKLYEPFWHSPLGDWIVRDGAGNFDERAFLDLVTHLIGKRQARAGHISENPVKDPAR